jgi:hypothetical protein
MECIVTLTESQVIALEVFSRNSDIQEAVQKIIDNITTKQIDMIMYSYVRDKLEEGKRIGFTNKSDLVVSAKNEGYIQNNLEYIAIAKV